MNGQIEENDQKVLSSGYHKKKGELAEKIEAKIKEIEALNEELAKLKKDYFAIDNSPVRVATDKPSNLTTYNNGWSLEAALHEATTNADRPLDIEEFAEYMGQLINPYTNDMGFKFHPGTNPKEVIEDRIYTLKKSLRNVGDGKFEAVSGWKPGKRGKPSTANP
jgi:hypothetical protein